MGEEFSYLIHISFFSVKLRLNSAGELYKRVMLKWEMGQDGIEMEFTVGSMVIIRHTRLPSLNCSVWFWYSGRYQAYFVTAEPQASLAGPDFDVMFSVATMRSDAP